MFLSQASTTAWEYRRKLHLLLCHIVPNYDWLQGPLRAVPRPSASHPRPRDDSAPRFPPPPFVASEQDASLSGGGGAGSALAPGGSSQRHCRVWSRPQDAASSYLPHTGPAAGDISSLPGSLPAAPHPTHSPGPGPSPGTRGLEDGSCSRGCGGRWWPSTLLRIPGQGTCVGWAGPMSPAGRERRGPWREVPIGVPEDGVQSEKGPWTPP